MSKVIQYPQYTDPTLNNRVTNLENGYAIYQYFNTITNGTTGVVSKPTSGTIIANWFGGTVTGIVTKADINNRPLDEPARNSANQIVTTTLDSGGNYVFSSTPAIYPVCIVFAFQLKLVDNLEVDWTKVTRSYNIENSSEIGYDADSTVKDALDDLYLNKQNNLGYTAENVVNKENTTLDNSITKYPTNNLVNNYVTEKRKLLNAGSVTQPVVTDLGNGLINISSILANFNTLPDFSGSFVQITIPALNNVQLVANQYTYIIATYNAGVATYSTTTDNNIINHSTILNVVQLYWENLNAVNELHVFYTGDYGLGLVNKLGHRLIHTERFGWESGLTLSETGTRNILISAGRLWYDGHEIDTLPVNSASINNEAHFYFKTGGIWQVSKVTTYNNTQFQNGNNLGNLGANDYGVNWHYKCANQTDYCHFYVLGTGSFKLDEAIASQPPALPDIIKKQAIFVGRIIVKNGENTAIQIDSAFAEKFAPSTNMDHADLINLDYSNSGHTGFVSLAQTTPQTIGSDSNRVLKEYLTDLDVTNYPKVNNKFINDEFAKQNGTILYHTAAWITGTTVSTIGTTVIKTGGSNFLSTMVGAKIIINNEERIIATYVNTDTITINSSFTTNYTGSSFSVHVKAIEVGSDGVSVTLRSGVQSGGAPPNTIIMAYNGGYLTNNYGWIVGPNYAAYLSEYLFVQINYQINWSSTVSYGGAKDLGLKRHAANILEINNGTSGQFADLKLRRTLQTAYATKSTTYQILTTDKVLEFKTNNTFTVTLPTAISNEGLDFEFINSSGSGVITINTLNSSTIDASLTYTLNPRRSLVVVSDGSNWQIKSKTGGRKIIDAGLISALQNAANWSVDGLWTGTITNGYEEDYYADNDYKYEMYSNNAPIRTPRV